jgi:hypothetical protein
MDLAWQSACIVSCFQPHLESSVIKPTAGDEFLFRAGVAFASVCRGICARKEAGKARVLAGLGITLMVISLPCLPARQWDATPHCRAAKDSSSQQVVLACRVPHLVLIPDARRVTTQIKQVFTSI